MIVLSCFIGFNTQLPCEYKVHDVYKSYLSCATAAREEVDKRNDLIQKKFHGDKIVTVCMPSQWEFLNDIEHDAKLTVNQIEYIWSVRVTKPTS